jgi:hypothetical protein
MCARPLTSAYRYPLPIVTLAWVLAACGPGPAPSPPDKHPFVIGKIVSVEERGERWLRVLVDGTSYDRKRSDTVRIGEACWYFGIRFNGPSTDRVDSPTPIYRRPASGGQYLPADARELRPGQFVHVWLPDDPRPILDAYPGSTMAGTIVIQPGTAVMRPRHRDLPCPLGPSDHEA